MKKCTMCGLSKEIKEFPKTKRSLDGYAQYCKECKNTKHNSKRTAKGRREEYAEYKHKYRESTLMRVYGIGIEEYDRLRTEQGFCCKICNTHETQSAGKGLLHIDHCHVTGKGRGLLCSKCNVGLGHFNDNIELLERSIEYLLGE